MVKLPLKGPTPFGLELTLIEQTPCAANLGTQLWVSTKPLETEIPLIAIPGLLMLTVWGGLVVLALCVPKLRLVAETDNAPGVGVAVGVAVAVAVAVDVAVALGVAVAVAVAVSVAVAVAVTVGVAVAV